MITATIRQRLHNYLDVADEKKLKAMYTMVEEDIEQHDKFEMSREEIAFLDEERDKHLRGDSLSYSWEAAREIIRKR